MDVNVKQGIRTHIVMEIMLVIFNCLSGCHSDHTCMLGDIMGRGWACLPKNSKGIYPSMLFYQTIPKDIINKQ